MNGEKEESKGQDPGILGSLQQEDKEQLAKETVNGAGK